MLPLSDNVRLGDHTPPQGFDVSEQKLKEMIIAMATMLEWIADILNNGNEPSDFALSYPMVQQVWDLQRFWDAHEDIRRQ